ncbi:MAG TPA: diacylglycerol kinase family protein [Candidatus Angelobacter sp.]|nr:diacylglycerol kinase family protein [Candidatus Angelobacter sp.]
MKKAVLIYNPASGRKRERRAEQIARAAEVLRAAGVQAETCPTTCAGSAIEQAQQAVAAGADTLIACGGDGTVHEVLNGLMLAGGQATLGVIPLGSGNLLATDLRLPKDTEAAARALLTYQPREVRAGAIAYQAAHGGENDKRYVIVTAGVGADAELMYQTAVRLKERWGMYAYFLEMARMIFRHDFPMFEAEWQAENGDRRKAAVALVMAVRADRFPGLLRRVRLGGALIRDDYRLMIFKTDKVRHFLSFFFSLVSGWNWSVRQVEMAHSPWVRCTPLATGGDHAIHCEADGELLGALPVEITIEERTFKLLMP